MLALGPEVKAYHFQWGNFKLHIGLVYQRWLAPGRGSDLLQLLVPCVLCPQVVQIIYD